MNQGNQGSNGQPSNPSNHQAHPPGYPEFDPSTMYALQQPNAYGLDPYQEYRGGDPSQNFLSYKGKHPVYAAAFSNFQSNALIAAVGSFIPSDGNYISILEVNESQSMINCARIIRQRYPCTKIMFNPIHNVS